MYNLDDKILINCDEAVYLSNLSKYKKLKFNESLKFKMHTLMCKPCKTYDEHNKIIEEKINLIKKKYLKNTSKTSLSKERKDFIKSKIKENI